MLRKILVPVRGDGMVASLLGHAAALATRHRAHVVVAHCRAQAKDLMPSGVPLPAFARSTFLKQAQELADQQEHHLRSVLHRLAAEFGLSEGDPMLGEAASCAFIEQNGRMADVISSNGRLADLIVVAKPDRDRNLGTNSLKAGLFSTGRPVLMCPGQKPAPGDLGARIAIGWNGSLEAARAVAMTTDLLQAADEVTILTGGDSETQGATTKDLVDYYRLRGIAANIVRFDARNPGAALLEKTLEIGADLLVMGAYGQSHERETLFGGNTQTVVDHATIPVLFVH